MTMGLKFILGKLKESLSAVTPISITIIIISLIIGAPSILIINFCIGAVFLIIGLTLFSIGSHQSTVALAESIGEYIVKKRKLWFFILIAFLVGLFITAAEPNLWVLADQVKTVISEPIMILFVAFGIGSFFTLAVLRILFQISLRNLIFITYSLVIIFAIIVYIVSPEFVSLAFDSGGGATGPMAVPFILSLGYGISKARGDKSSEDDSFGLIGIAAIGPIVAVLFLGLFKTPATPELDLSTTFFGYFLQSLVQMAIAVLPFIAFFLIFHFFVFNYKKSKVIKILIAFIYTYIGLVLFLTGANAGLVNIGHYIGTHLALSGYTWTLIPIGMLFGFTIVSAEPSVITLNHQVEEVTAGAINRKFMMIAMSVGVSVAIGLAMLRVLTGISILWFLIPGYAIALGLSFLTPKIFTSIAFDSGSAASGALTTAFLTPFAFGSADVLNANVLLDAFGLITFVVMAPLITIQLLGIVYKFKLKKIKMILENDEVIDLSEVKI